MAQIDEPQDWISPRKIVRVTAARSAIVTDYQLLCQAGPYAFEVVVTELDSPRRIDLSGQVTLLGRGDMPASDLPLSVVYRTSGDVTAQTSTDEFGEFACAVPRSGPAGVRVGVGEDAPIVAVFAG